MLCLRGFSFCFPRKKRLSDEGALHDLDPKNCFFPLSSKSLYCYSSSGSQIGFGPGKSSERFDFAGHYRHYPVDYKAAVTELLGKAAAIYSQRHSLAEHESLGFEGAGDALSNPIFNHSRAAAHPSQGSDGLSLALSDQFLVPTSVESYNGSGMNFGSVQDNHQEGVVQLPARPSINAHGALGQILFDVCVPKDVEDWDIKQSYYSGRRSFISSRRHATFNPIKCMLRSRL